MAEWFRRKSKNIKTFDKRDTKAGEWQKCPECNAKVSIRTSRTTKNPNRPFYSCQGEDDCWIGWVDEIKKDNTT